MARGKDSDMLKNEFLWIQLKVNDEVLLNFPCLFSDNNETQCFEAVFMYAENTDNISNGAKDKFLLSFADAFKEKPKLLTLYQHKDRKPTSYVEVFTLTHSPFCSAWQVLMRWWHLVDTLQQSSRSSFPWDRTITFWFGEAYLFSTVHRKQTAAVVTDDIWRHTGQYLNKSIGQRHHVCVSHSLDRTKAITSLHLSVEQEQKHTRPAYCTPCEAYFWCGQVPCQAVKAAMMEGVWLSLPSGCIMTSERDIGVANRTLSCGTSYGKVGAEQTAAQSCLLKCVSFYNSLRHSLL